ncbi:hypothetical protein CAFE_31380 [Caprobacter fermentans]|uniref:Uncharacterized protein n=2 Tax=Caproicibacter fermentans TaxID=2576756 RepID=A0A6N8I316_9FIRM|nr:hypothetical protein [Caproicibacter fermentans]
MHQRNPKSGKETSPLSYGITSILIVIFIIVSCLRKENPYDIVSLSACVEALESYKKMKTTRAKIDIVIFIASVVVCISALLLFLII